MRAIRYMLQVAAYLLCLVSGRPFRIPEVTGLAACRERTPEPIRVKPSPIDMLKAASH